MKVSLILKGAADFFQRYPVYVRYSEGQKRTFKKTSLLLTKEQYNRFAAHNHLPKEKDLYVKFLGAIDAPVEKTKTTNFFTFCITVGSEREKETKPETMKQFFSEQNKLRRFRESFTLQDVTPVFLKQYKDYCKSIGNKENTVWKSFKFIKLILLKALKAKLITENPFEVFDHPKYKDPQRQYLTQSEIDRIDNLDRNLPEEILFVAGWFLISCYTGLRYADLAVFDKKKHIVDGRLVMYTLKTGELVSIPINDKLRGLFERVDYKPLRYKNQPYNRLLKQVQGLAEIDTVLTAHLARHSAAVRWANLGISQEVVSKILGHRSLATTSIYYKITGSRIDAELSKV